MRVYKKREILKLLKTMQYAHGKLKNRISKINSDVCYQYLEDLQNSAIAIGNAIEETNKNMDIVGLLEDYCEYVFQCAQAQNNYLKMMELDKMKHQCGFIREKILNEVETDKLQVIFMPYKADMWTSFESIWQAAKNDDECDVKVIPIPYYDITDPGNIKKYYEIARFSQDIEMESYLDYDLEENHPDIIFIHNPYDEYNNLTRVPQQYFSYNLRQNAGMLVYSPYFTIGTFNNKQDFMFTMPGVLNADYILAQSDRVKNIFTRFGIDERKVLSFGSPKIDEIILNEKKEYGIKEEWKEKIRGRKVFLLNTHLSYFPKALEYQGSMNNYAVKFHQEIMDTFLNNEKCALIWRPHPLLKNMLQGRYPECLEFINLFENRVRESNNGIIDDTGDYYYAFHCSDALISTWSSLVNEYMVTGKPILIMQKKMDDKTVEQSPIDRNKNYFRLGKDRITFSQFRDNVLKNFDPLYEERIKEVHRAFPNMNGDAGEKIYSYLKNTMEGEW